MDLCSLQSLNEVLAVSSKDESKAAVVKQVRRHSKASLGPSGIYRLSQTSYCCLSSLQVQEVNLQLQKEKEAEVQARQAARGADQASGGGGGSGGGKGWNEEDLQLLIKAVNLFPAGTNAR